MDAFCNARELTSNIDARVSDPDHDNGFVFIADVVLEIG
jgi:hypothetical protein